MFTSKDIYLHINTSDVLRDISEYDIFRKYVSNFEELNKKFKSDLYKDTNPSCIIYQDKNNRLQYKDHGEPSHAFTCFDYVIFKYKCTLPEAVRIVANDFGLLKFNTNDKPKFLLGEPKEVILTKEKSYITIEPRNWNLIDFNYWNPFNLTFDDLREDTIPCKHVYLHKNDRKIVFNHSDSNPIYAYKEFDWETNEFLGYKIYLPLNPIKQYKWMCCADVTRSIVGYKDLPEIGDLLIITKSRKDVKILNKLGYNAISLHAEGSNLDEKVVNILKSRFKRIITLFDNDTTGLLAGAKLYREYGFKAIIIPYEYKSKDTGELMSKNGEKVVKTVLKQLIDDNT